MSADTEVFMRWDAPERIPTNLEGIIYRVECRPAGENDVSFFKTYIFVANYTKYFQEFDPSQSPIFFTIILKLKFYIFKGFAPWTIISNRIEDEAVLIKHLNPNGIYQFRIIAKTSFGWGEPSITSRIIQTHPKGAYFETN